MEIKYGMHVPTEQYGYISCDLDGTAEDAVRAYSEIADLIRLPKYGAGMDKKQYEEIIDLMIAGEPIQGDPGELETMNSIQKFAFDLVRKSTNRIAYKNR